MPSAASRRLLKDLPTEDEMTEIVLDLKRHGEVATAILGAAYLENALEKILKAKFVPLNKEDERRMFDGASRGILGGFAAKIRLAYAINILGPVSYHDLMLINDIRNVFVHSLHKVSFSNALVSEDCRKLKFHDHFYEIAYPTVAPTLAQLLTPVDPLEKFAETVFALYVSMLNLLLQSYSPENALPAHHLDSARRDHPS